MNLKNPQAELDKILSQIKDRLEDTIASARRSAEEAEKRARVLIETVKVSELEGSLATFLKADHALVAPLDMGYQEMNPSDVRLQIGNCAYVDFGRVKLPLGKHRALLLVFLDPSSKK